MRFHPDPPRDHEPPPATEHPGWRLLLLTSAACGVLCTKWPWIRVQFERLFGTHEGPPGWQSSAGFTALCSCLLIAVMVFVESETTHSRRAVRPASLLIAAITAVVLAFEWANGPGSVRGVSGTWTVWFYALLASTSFMLAACLRRWSLVQATRVAAADDASIRALPDHPRGPGTHSPRPRADSRDTPGPDPNDRGSSG
jgi:hypothetical protein